ncbi:MAG TPA: hypothetical protein VMZ29_16060 [Candidatus Bathyarchaeia archaeon]|nr:hypothetical protein [Candidatus Bathyarchaeia archaeon]
MLSKNYHYKFFILFLVVIILSNGQTIKSIVDFKVNVEVQINENTVVLNTLEYHVVTINATEGEALSGFWEVSPADIFSPPFLVFIVDSNNLAIWESSTNLTQAINRIPSSEILYLYDPYFRIDDIIGDNYRSANINVKVPKTGLWHLVLFAGTSLLPLTFSWDIDVIEGKLLDIILYSFFGFFTIVGMTIFIIKIFKDRKLSPEKELAMIIRDQSQIKKKELEGLGSLEEANEEYIDN